ncbi:hypothetical protein D3C71_1342780 [compost metagenome]
MQTVAVVKEVLFVLFLLSLECIQALLAAVAAVGLPRRQQLIDHLVVTLQAFSLVEGAFVPIHTQPLHRVQDGVDCTLLFPFHVGIFNTQNKFAVIMACIEPGIESCSCPAYV